MASISLSLMSLKSQSLLPHPLYLFIKCGHLFVAPARLGFCIGLAQLAERFFHGEFLGHDVRGAPQFLARLRSTLGSMIPPRKTVNRSRGFPAFYCGRRNGRKRVFGRFSRLKLAHRKCKKRLWHRGLLKNVRREVETRPGVPRSPGLATKQPLIAFGVMTEATPRCPRRSLYAKRRRPLIRGNTVFRKISGRSYGRKIRCAITQNTFVSGAHKLR